MTGRPLLVVILVLAALGVLGADAARRFVADTSMEHFLPGQDEKQLYRVSRQVIDSTLTGRMMITVGLRDSTLSREERRDKLRDATLSFATDLRAIPGFSNITAGPPEGLEDAFFKLYFPRRFAFFSLDPVSDAAKMLSTKGLDERAHRLKEKLGGAESLFVRRLAPRDPWLFFLDFLTEAEGTALRLEIHEGQFFARPHTDKAEGVGPDEDFAILFAELRESALDSSAQGPVLARLRASTAALRATHGAELIVESSGANRFAVATEASMKADIERVFAASTLGLIALFIAFFRSGRRVFFLLLPIAGGLVCALWVSLIVFGKVHALTLAFGGALIGVAIDYPVHVLCHHDLSSPGQSGPDTVRRLLPTLCVAAGTTVVGLLGLGWTAFPGIREIAVFSGVGVVAALGTTWLTSRLLPDSGRAPHLAIGGARLLSLGLSRLRARRWISWALLTSALLLTVVGLSVVRFAPGLDSLAPLDQGLLDEDERVRARIGQADGGKLAIALGKDLEGALRTNEKIAHLLRQAQRDNLIGSYTNVATLLRSAEVQARAQRAISQSQDLAPHTIAALERAGFVAAGFADLQEEIRSVPAPLTYADLKKTPLAPLIAPLIFQAGDEVAVISPLGDLKQPAKLRARLSAIENAHFFSQRALLNQAYADLRQRTTELLLVGLLLVFLTALLRYRRLRPAAAALLPSVLAAGATVGLLSLVGQELNLLHLLGLLLVCSMGVDYGVFLVDAKSEHQGPALLSISIGCLSTMLSFGALSLSSAPALVALGSTVGVGIVLSLLIAPTAFLLLSPDEKTASP